MLASTSAMPHHHQWQDEPPEGKLFWNKSFDQRYGDEEDMASNAMFQSPEEIQRLRLLLKNDPEFETSSSWPNLVEWCTTCTSTRLVRLILPKEENKVLEPVAEKEEAIVAVCKLEEEDSSCEATAKDACTQTPQRRRRRGGRGSRMRRLLAFQLMLTQKKGLPLSRLLTLKESDTGISKRKELRRLQEETASPVLRRKIIKVVKVEENEVKDGLVDLKKEEEGCFSMGALSGGSTTFTPRSSQPDVAVPTLDSVPLPTISSSPHLSPPSYLWLPMHPSTSFYSSPPCGLMPGHQWLICGTCHSWGSVIMT